MSGVVVVGTYEEPRVGDQVGHLVDAAVSTEYDSVGTVMETRRATDGAWQVRVRWEFCADDIGPWEDADELIVIWRAAS